MSFINTYKQYKAHIPASSRDLLRRLALNGLSLFNDRGYIKKPRIQFLYIHHIFNDELEPLRNLLSALGQTHQFISYSEAVDMILNNNIDTAYICLSSDDGFKNNLEGAKVMQEFGAKACFFVNPKMIGEKDEIKITQHCKERLNFPPVEFLTWEELNQLQQMGHEIGSHTMEHNNVAKMSNEEFKEDCLVSKQVLSEKCGEIKHFAFPYGRFTDFNNEARKIVFESGFRSCASAERGCHVNSSHTLSKEELCIRRDHIILDWPLKHINYFLISSSKAASENNNLFPY